jgi:hypothetical protein
MKKVTFDERVRVREMDVTMGEHKMELQSPPSIIVDGQQVSNHTCSTVWLPYILIGGCAFVTFLIILLFTRSKKPEKNNTDS